MKINISDTIYKIVSKDDKLKEILGNNGFENILKPNMIQTVGRLVSLKNGIKMRKVDINLLSEILNKEGYVLIDE